MIGGVFKHNYLARFEILECSLLKSQNTLIIVGGSLSANHHRRHCFAGFNKVEPISEPLQLLLFEGFIIEFISFDIKLLEALI